MDQYSREVRGLREQSVCPLKLARGDDHRAGARMKTRVTVGPQASIEGSSQPWIRYVQWVQRVVYTSELRG